MIESADCGCALLFFHFTMSMIFAGLFKEWESAWLSSTISLLLCHFIPRSGFPAGLRCHPDRNMEGGDPASLAQDRVFPFTFNDLLGGELSKYE